jgi:hypothetical protein
MTKYASQSQVATFNRLATGTPISVMDFKVSVKFALQPSFPVLLHLTSKWSRLLSKLDPKLDSFFNYK